MFMSVLLLSFYFHLNITTIMVACVIDRLVCLGECMFGILMIAYGIVHWVTLCCLC